MRARIGPCKCGLGTNGPETNEWDYLQCASEDNQFGCQWTPWSPPSSPATPGSMPTEQDERVAP